MPTLDELIQRVQAARQIDDPRRTVIAQVVTLGFRGSLDPDEAERAMQTGRVDPDAEQEIFAEYQRYWRPDLDALAERTYGRELKVDGNAGQVTLRHVFNRVCGMPDRLYADDGTLKPMEARWPDACKNDLKWHVDYSGHNESTFGLSREEIEAEFVQAAREYMLLFDVKLTRVQSAGEAHLRESFARLGGSTLGIHYLANDTCSPKSGQLNVMRWPSLDYLGQVMRHEWGHGLGAHHKPGHTLMNPSIVWPLNGRVQGTGFTQIDVDWIRALGYGPGSPPPDDDPDDPGDPTPQGWRCRVDLKDGSKIYANRIRKIVSTVGDDVLIRLGRK